jgi:hypothetical protein
MIYEMSGLPPLSLLHLVFCSGESVCLGFSNGMEMIAMAVFPNSTNKMYHMTSKYFMLNLSMLNQSIEMLSTCH